MEKDVVWIMKAIKKLSVGIDENENEAVTAYDVVKSFYDLRQIDGESIDKFRDRFEESWKTAEAGAGLNCSLPLQKLLQVLLQIVIHLSMLRK